MLQSVLIKALLGDMTKLLVAVATVEKSRASLAALPAALFQQVVAELEASGVSRKVVADMFNLPLTTLRRRIAKAQSQAAQEHEPLRLRVGRLIHAAGPMSAEDVLCAFYAEDDRVVRAVLRDLREAGLARTEGPLWRLTDVGEAHIVGAAAEEDAITHTLLYQRGPMTHQALAEALGTPQAALAPSLARLRSQGRVVPRADGTLHAPTLFMERGELTGWKAAVYDHLHAVVKTLTTRLGAQDHDWMPSAGSTYRFDLWPGHPLADAIRDELDATRDRLQQLWDDTEAYNQAHPAPENVVPSRIVTYVGRACEADA